jgi:hypothetical protein
VNTEDPLIEWNRLNKENAEHGFVSSLYQSMSETTTTVDKFSMWLLAGTGATGALLIAQIKSVLPHLTQNGFKVCMVLLVISAICGFLAKYKSLHCEIQTQMQIKLVELTKPVFEKHKKDEEVISKYAEQRGIQLDTEIELSKIITEYSRPFPWWLKKLIERKVEQMAGDRQAGFHTTVKAYMSQLRWTFFQAVLFLSFMVAGAWYAIAI